MPNQTQFINIDDQIPESVSLRVGDDLIFVRLDELCGGKWLHKLESADQTVLDNLNFPQVVGNMVEGQPEGTRLHKGFVAVKAGVTELTIQFAPPNPMSKPFDPQTIKVTVAERCE